ncbi:DNA-protecting protein DprA [Candidatus Uhrbacteria bacterium]|nr:DNA-protecting protein DprA [Candidatus Uhrbacteria bacterium]
MSQWNRSRLGWLALASFPGFGSSTLHKLASIFKNNGEYAWNISYKELSSFIRKKSCIENFIVYRSNTHPEKIAADLEKKHISFLLDTDTDFPHNLKTIHQAPKALFYTGDIKIAHEPRIAIIGTRSMTDYGMHVTQELTRACVQYGITIISGLALGIDGCAHQTAIEAQGKTIAILGSGIDEKTIYPKQHIRLAKQIIERGGALISENPIGYEAYKFDFPLRNRLISGLSQAVLVIEGAHKSGSLITAHLASEQGREVLAVPGMITSKQSQGTNDLIQKGAIPCLGIDNILEALHLEPSKRRTQTTTDLNDNEQYFLDQITSPLTIDQVTRLTKIPVNKVLQLISRLEIMGFIHRLDQGYITRTVPKF